MLIRSDIVPGPWGSFRVRGQAELVDAGGAMTAIVRGDEVTPADEATTERLAVELDQRGNGTRAAMFRRIGKIAAPVVLEEPAEPAAEQVPDQGEPAPVPEVAPSEPVAEAQAVIAAAGDDMPQLLTLAHRAGFDASPRWKADRLKAEIQAAVSRNLADNKPAFSG